MRGKPSTEEPAAMAAVVWDEDVMKRRRVMGFMSSVALLLYNELEFKSSKRGAEFHGSSFLTTSPETSAKRKSHPQDRKVRRVCSMAKK